MDLGKTLPQQHLDRVRPHLGHVKVLRGVVVDHGVEPCLPLDGHRFFPKSQMRGPRSPLYSGSPLRMQVVVVSPESDPRFGPRDR